MRAVEATVKTLGTYLAAILSVAAVLSVQIVYESGEWSSFGSSLLFMVLFSAVFALPVFLFVGLPYLVFGFPSWGEEHPKLFVLVGAMMGGLGSLAFGMVMVMPEAVPSFFALAGSSAGAVSSLVWAQLSTRVPGDANA